MILFQLLISFTLFIHFIQLLYSLNQFISFTYSIYSYHCFTSIIFVNYLLYSFHMFTSFFHFKYWFHCFLAAFFRGVFFWFVPVLKHEQQHKTKESHRNEKSLLKKWWTNREKQSRKQIRKTKSRKHVVVPGGYRTAGLAPDLAPREERERRAGSFEGSRKPST